MEHFNKVSLTVIAIILCFWGYREYSHGQSVQALNDQVHNLEQEKTTLQRQLDQTLLALTQAKEDSVEGTLERANEKLKSGFEEALGAVVGTLTTQLGKAKEMMEQYEKEYEKQYKQEQDGELQESEIKQKGEQL